MILLSLLVSQLFQNPDNRTTYTVQRRGEIQFLDNVLTYPLVENMDYVVRVRNISCVCVRVVWGDYLNELSFLFHDLFMRTLSSALFPSSPPPFFHHPHPHPHPPPLVFLQVFASNPTGNGLPSENVTFNTTSEC